MRPWARIAVAVVLVQTWLLPTKNVGARSLLDDRVIFGEDFTLKEGERLQGDLIVLGGNVMLETTAEVSGNVFIVGGQLVQEGIITGDAVVLGGQVVESGSVGHDLVVVGAIIRLSASANVKGNVIAVGTEVDRAPGAVVEGQILEPLPRPDPSGYLVPPERSTTTMPGVPGSLPDRPAKEGGAAGILVQTLGMGALAMLMGMVVHPQLQRAGHAIFQRPANSGCLGALVITVLPLAVLIMTLTIILIPAALATGLAASAAWLFGIVAIGNEIGDRLGQALRVEWSPVLLAGLGTALLSLSTAVLWKVPCVGPIAGLALGVVALGGTLLTWLGATRRAFKATSGIDSAKQA